MSDPAAIAARFDYEYLGKTPELIASHYGFPIKALLYEIEAAGWERKLDPVKMPDTKDLATCAAQLLEISTDRLSIIAIVRQLENQSAYAALEGAILAKATEAATHADPEDRNIGTKLINLAKTLASIQERNPIRLAGEFGDALDAADGSKRQLVVQILNQVTS